VRQHVDSSGVNPFKPGIKSRCAPLPSLHRPMHVSQAAAGAAAAGGPRAMEMVHMMYEVMSAAPNTLHGGSARTPGG
jgi:hypothetical protein